MKIVKQKKGQFIIIAVLMIAIMMVSIAAIMYSAVTYYRYEKWEEYLLIIDNLKMGSRRLMEICLANFTQFNFEKYAIDRTALNQTLGQWKNDLRKSMPGQGLSIDLLDKTQLISPPKVIGGTYIPERWARNFIKCYWFYPVSLSSIFTELSANLSSSGLQGYRSPIFISLQVEIDMSYLEGTPSEVGAIKITMTHQDGLPVKGLKANNFEVYRFDPSVDDWSIASLSKVSRSLGGKYLLTFTGSIEKPYYKWLIIKVTDTRGITVVCATYSRIEFMIEKNTPISGRPANSDDEIYTLEAGVRGQWYWNGKQLNVEAEGGVPLITPPLPPIPIKQFRVNVTENGVDSTSVETPCQYEIWDKIDWHDQLIDVPKNLADPFYRFNSTNRMVFQVKFPTLNITRQKVTIWWIDDMDAQPYQGPSDLEYFEGFYEAKTNVYRVEFMDEQNWDPRPEYRWPYYGIAALLLKDPDTLKCYGPWNLHGFDLASTPPGTAKWRPYGQWEIKYWYGGTGAKAVVRLIAILNSTQVQNVWSQSWSTVRSDYYDTYAVVFLTANVKYLQQRVWVYWKETKTGRGVWFSWEWGKGETVRYAYLSNQTGVVAGPYLYDYDGTNHIEYDNPGYWASHWNDQMGRGLIFNVGGHNSLYSLNENHTCFSVTHWAPEWWPRYKQGSIEFEAIQCDHGEGSPQQCTVTTGTNYSYNPSMWMYGGGQENGYQEVADYHYMFLEPYAPIIIVPEGG